MKRVGSRERRAEGIGETACVLSVFVIASLIWCTLACSCRADVEIPPGSFVKLQEVFTRLHTRLWEISEDSWHHGQFERCIATSRLITAVNPYDMEAYSGGAWLMQNQDRDDEAEAYLREGLMNNPDVYDMYWELGYFCYMRERFPEAISYIETAAAFGVPEFVLHTLAHAYEHAGDRSTALNIWIVREEAEPDSNVPAMQIDRILDGRPPTISPEMARHRLGQCAEDKEPAEGTNP